MIEAEDLQRRFHRGERGVAEPSGWFRGFVTKVEDEP